MISGEAVHPLAATLPRPGMAPYLRKIANVQSLVRADILRHMISMSVRTERRLPLALKLLLSCGIGAARRRQKMISKSRRQGRDSPPSTSREQNCTSSRPVATSWWGKRRSCGDWRATSYGTVGLPASPNGSQPPRSSPSEQPHELVCPLVPADGGISRSSRGGMARFPGMLTHGTKGTCANWIGRRRQT